MKSLFVLVSILVTACAGASAGTGTPLSLTTDHAAPPALVLSTEPAAQRSFPERVAPAKLPSADRAGLAGRLTAGVKLCVAPDGRVHSVAVEKSSGTAAFDQALAADVPSWQFAPYKAPTELKVCERVNITYVSH
jgi:TonB family protein